MIVFDTNEQHTWKTSSLNNHPNPIQMPSQPECLSLSLFPSLPWLLSVHLYISLLHLFYTLSLSFCSLPFLPDEEQSSVRKFVNLNFHMLFICVKYNHHVPMFPDLKKPRYGQTDGPTNKHPHRDAWTYLKSWKVRISPFSALVGRLRMKLIERK